MQDPWLSAAAYERFMGRWSTRVAERFLSWLAIAPGRTWLDVGCGTGSLSKVILAAYQPRRMIAVDSSLDLISHARGSPANAALEASVGLAQSLQIRSNVVDAVVSGLVLNFVPQPEQAFSEMLRVTKPGGQIGVFLWDYADGMQMLRRFWDAAARLDPAARQLDEGARFPLCREGRLASLARAAGLEGVETVPIEIETVFRDFDDYWQPFLGNVGPAPAYVMSLDRASRHRLEFHLRADLPVEVDGTISMTARAWAIKGAA